MLQIISQAELRAAAIAMFNVIIDQAGKGTFVKFDHNAINIYNVNRVDCPWEASTADMGGTMRQFGETLYRLAGGEIDPENPNVYVPLENNEMWPLIELLLSGKARSFPTIARLINGESALALWWRQTKDKRSQYSSSMKASFWSLLGRAKVLNPFGGIDAEEKALRASVLISVFSLVAFFWWNSPYFLFASTYVAGLLYVVASLAIVLIGNQSQTDPHNSTEWNKQVRTKGSIIGAIVLAIFSPIFLGMICFSTPSYEPPASNSERFTNVSDYPVLVDRNTGEFAYRIQNSSYDHFLTIESWFMDLFRFKVVEGMPVKYEIKQDLTDKVKWSVEYELSSKDRYLAALAKWQNATTLNAELTAFMDAERPRVTRETQQVIAEYRGRMSDLLKQEKAPEVVPIGNGDKAALDAAHKLAEENNKQINANRSALIEEFRQAINNLLQPTNDSLSEKFPDMFDRARVVIYAAFEDLILNK